MAKLPRVTAREIVSVLKHFGFILSRQDDSHQIYKDSGGKRATVPLHGSKILHPKVLRNIMKDAGLTAEDL